MATATNIVGNGAHTYEYDRAWAQVPDGIPMPAAAVFGDDEDRVYCFNRNPEHPIMIFDRDGKFIKSWGAGMFEFPHAIIIDQWGYVWLVDRNMGQIFKLTRDGEPVMTIGVHGYRSETGARQHFLRLQFLAPGGARRRPFQYAGRHCAERRRRNLHRRRLRQRPRPQIHPVRQAHLFLGASPVPAPASSTCPTAPGSTARATC